MASDPPGLLLVTPSGALQQLLVLSHEQCAAQADFAELHAAPARVVRRLRNRSHVGFFLEDPASYSSDEAFPWDDLLHRATVLGDSGNRWYAALVAEPPPNIDYLPDAVCHDAWRRTRHSNRPPNSSVLQL